MVSRESRRRGVNGRKIALLQFRINPSALTRREKLPQARGNVQNIGSGQTHKRQVITLHLKGYLVPVICKRTHHSKESVERYIHDYEAIKLLASTFDDVDLISRIVRLKTSVVKQYLDLIPLDPHTSHT